MSAHAIMVLGTSSHVGKSLLAAALCRILTQEGYRVAPFKAQNMSLNSAVTHEGLEIGRAQALQAEAARILPSVHMNPILLKPAGNMTSQVVVHGRIWGNLSATDYHKRRVSELFPLACESYRTLALQYDVIVLEGAGSPAEINLKSQDIVNMRMAEFADASCILIGDIDRGGVFASLLGTVELLEPQERERIVGFAINKFRGDVTLLEPGIRMIEERLGKPCLAVVPYLPDLTLDEEDSLGLPPLALRLSEEWQSSSDDPERRLRIGIVALPSISNFTDFDSLRAEPSVSLELCRTPEHLSTADVIIIPGSKQTADDLRWMRSQGIDQSVSAQAGRSLIIGICGGMQILGSEIVDSHKMESGSTVEGLGLLAMRTNMQPNKTTRASSGLLVADTLFGQSISSCKVTGYEIHIGQTEYLPGSSPFARLAGREGTDIFDGCSSSNGHVCGTYLHGIFDDDGFRHLFLRSARAFHRLLPPHRLAGWSERREQSLKRLSDTVREAFDLTTLFALAGKPSEKTLPEEAL